MDQGARHGCSEPRRKRIRWITAALMLLCGATAPAWAFDAEETFKKGTFVLSGEGGYGWQVNDEHFRHVTNLEFYDVGARFSLLPLEPLGRDHFWYGALELGLEPLYQHYTTPKQAFWGGLAAVVRYHFLALGRFVPYVEIAGSAGGTDLEIPEIKSAFAFLLFGGLGASVFVSDKTALYLGYRFQHVSNGDTSKPNRGFESNVVVGGVSFYFP
jgi:opacity protein-like surface antigen